MEEIDLLLLLKEFWKKKKLIIVIFCITFVIISLFFIIRNIEKEKTISTEYFSKSTILITDENDEEKENASSQIKNINNTLVALIESDIVLDEVKTETGMEKIEKENIFVSTSANQIINIGVLYKTSEDATLINKTLLNVTQKLFDEENTTEGYEIKTINYPESFCEEYSEEIINEFMESSSSATVTTKENASRAKPILKIIVLAAIASGILSFGTVFVMFIFDSRIKTPEQIENLGIGIIDSLENMNNKEYSIENELTTIFDFKSNNSKIFKIIATKILNKINNIDENVIMLTSTNAKEGKTYTASNIGTVLAMFGKKTIILDTNFEDPKLDKIFKVPNELGLSNYLTGISSDGEDIKETLNNFIQETDIKNLNIISAGNIKENITNCLVSDKIDELIKQLKFYYDFIILDSDCIYNKPNTLILAEKCNHIVLVVNEDTTKTEDLIKVKKDIESVNGKIFGVIFNRNVKK